MKTSPRFAANYLSLVLLSLFCLPSAARAFTEIVAWGADSNGATNIPSNSYGQTNVPPGLTNPLAVAAGGFHSLALLADGTVAGWGGINVQTNTDHGGTNFYTYLPPDYG